MNKYAVVWLDENASVTESNFREKLGDAQIFVNPADCLNFIRTHSNLFIYFIVSGTLAKEVVPQIYESDNVVQIFLFCGSVLKYTEWGIDYIDKLLMYDHGDDLLERLWSEMESHMRGQAKEYLKCADECKGRALKYKQQPCG